MITPSSMSFLLAVLCLLHAVSLSSSQTLNAWVEQALYNGDNCDSSLSPIVVWGFFEIDSCFNDSAFSSFKVVSNKKEVEEISYNAPDCPEHNILHKFTYTLFYCFSTSVLSYWNSLTPSFAAPANLIGPTQVYSYSSSCASPSYAAVQIYPKTCVNISDSSGKMSYANSCNSFSIFYNIFLNDNCAGEAFTQLDVQPTGCYDGIKIQCIDFSGTTKVEEELKKAVKGPKKYELQQHRRKIEKAKYRDLLIYGPKFLNITRPHL